MNCRNNLKCPTVTRSGGTTSRTMHKKRKSYNSSLSPTSKWLTSLLRRTMPCTTQSLKFIPTLRQRKPFRRLNSKACLMCWLAIAIGLWGTSRRTTYWISTTSLRVWSKEAITQSRSLGTSDQERTLSLTTISFQTTPWLSIISNLQRNVQDLAKM